jgi:hypothetical protein
MGTSNLQDELVAAESLMVDGQDEAAKKRLAALAEDAEEYVDANCQTTEDTQCSPFRRSSSAWPTAASRRILARSR